MYLICTLKIASSALTPSNLRFNLYPWHWRRSYFCTPLYSLSLLLPFFVTRWLQSCKCQVPAEKCGILSTILPQASSDPPLSSKKCPCILERKKWAPTTRGTAFRLFCTTPCQQKGRGIVSLVFFASPWQLGGGGTLSCCQLDFEASCQDSCQPDLQTSASANCHTAQNSLLKPHFRTTAVCFVPFGVVPYFQIKLCQICGL